MAYRFTNTEKWQDSWFSNLTQLQMLLFIYLCDNCDCAGFIEINIKRFAVDLNSNKDTIEGALKGLARGLIYSKTNDCIYIRNFLKHQKNLPLNSNNKAHLGIIKRFEIYTDKFEIQSINEFIEGASKGLNSSYGNGIGIGNGKSEEKSKKEIFDFKNSLILYGFSEKLIDEWLKIRKQKKCVNTETAFDEFIKQIELVPKKYNSIDEILIIIISKSWGGFEAKWLNNIDNNYNNQKQDNRPQQQKYQNPDKKYTGFQLAYIDALKGIRLNVYNKAQFEAQIKMIKHRFECDEDYKFDENNQLIKI